MALAPALPQMLAQAQSEGKSPVEKVEMTDPDRSQAWRQSHCGTKAEADAFAADIEKLAALEGTECPRITVERDREGGWNVWAWE